MVPIAGAAEVLSCMRSSGFPTPFIPQLTPFSLAERSPLHKTIRSFPGAAL